MRHMVTSIFVALAVISTGPATSATETPPQSQPATDLGIFGDSCFGDRYESDADLNEGNGISDQELRDLIELINGPGV